MTIYLDHAATTPIHPEVLEAMVDALRSLPGNASSIHRFGREARARITAARDEISSVIGCRPSELIFTSGGTESDNLAVIGAARAGRKQGKNHIITSAIEHHAVLHACAQLEKEGFDITILPVDERGRINPEAVRQALRPDTALVSIMWGNNEVGTLQPIAQIGELARQSGALMHVDAVQALGSLPIELHGLPVDAVSFSAHKINGPQGVGALYLAAKAGIEPLLYGGSQERKRRAGTENVAGIVGFAKAVQLNAAQDKLYAKTSHYRHLRDKLENTLKMELGEESVIVNGDQEARLPHISNVSLMGTDTETMLMNLDMAGIAAASGSACTSGSLERSHVLQAMGLPEERLNSAVRFSVGLGNTLEEVEEAAKKIATICRRFS